MEFAGCFGLVAAFIVIVAVCMAGYYVYNLSQPTVTRKARVIAKRTAVSQASGQSMVQTSYHCSFEFEDGQRAEYTIGQRQYGLIAEGDRGELDTKGVLFWDFRRKPH